MVENEIDWVIAVILSSESSVIWTRQIDVSVYYVNDSLYIGYLEFLRGSIKQ